MLTAQRSESFASLFKKYRLRSEIETLSQFGDLLAQEGLVYENSLFTHWQKGDRVPKDRKILLTTIKIFVKQGGVTSIEEANSLLASAQQRDLHAFEANFVGLTRAEKESQVDTDYDDNSPYFSLREILRSKYLQIVLALFIVQVIWNFRIQYFKLENTSEAYIWGIFYSLTALSGTIYGLLKLRTLPNSSQFRQTINFLSLSLLCQWFGLTIWNIYTLLGVLIPYPSAADIGYLTAIPFYVLAALSLFNSGVVSNERYKKYVYLLLPLLMLGALYSIFLQATGLSFLTQFRMFLNFSYPSGEIIPVLLAVYAWITHRSAHNRLMESISAWLTIAFMCQFISDYAFIYGIQINAYVNGGVNDLLYAVSYFVMNIVIVSINQRALNKSTAKDYLYKIKKQKSKKNYFSVSPLFHHELQ